MNRWRLFSAIFQILIGVAAITAYFIVTITEGFSIKWSITLILALGYTALGIISLARWCKTKKK